MTENREEQTEESAAARADSEDVEGRDGQLDGEGASAPAEDGTDGAVEPNAPAAEPTPTHSSPEEVAASPVEDLFLSPEDSESEVIEVGGEDGDTGELAPAPPVPAGEVVALKEQIEQLEQERDELKNRMLRVAADLENFRKRNAREKEELRKYGSDKVILELLPVVDNLERALGHAEKNADTTSITDGVRMVYRQFLGALEKHGVQGFESRGEMFDPQRHEAIQQTETSEHETGTIMEEFQKGYFLHERLIRPALVSVAKRVEGAQPSDASGEDSAASDDPEVDPQAQPAVQDGEAEEPVAVHSGAEDESSGESTAS